METKKEIEISNEGNSPAAMIRMAVSGGANLEQLEKLLALQERHEANEAKKAFHQAMSDFKANPPQIIKDKAVSFGQGKANYKHATLAQVCEKINSSLSKYGLSSAWLTRQDNGQISVTCKITHQMGHSEETTITAPADSSGSKNPIQAIGSTITYLQRYSLLALTGLATEDQDDDGAKSVQVETIDESQLSMLLDFIGATETNLEQFLKYVGCESLEEMPKNLYQKALNALQIKMNQQTKAGKK